MNKVLYSVFCLIMGLSASVSGMQNDQSRLGSQLITAVENGNTQGCLALIRQGANVNYRTSKDMTPLSMAVNKQPQLISLLMKNGAKPNHGGIVQAHILNLIVRNDDVELYHLLMNNLDLGIMNRFDEHSMKRRCAFSDNCINAQNFAIEKHGLDQNNKPKSEVAVLLKNFIATTL